MQNNNALTSALYLHCLKQTPPTPTRSNTVRSESSWQTGNPIVAKLEGCRDRVRRLTLKQFREPSLEESRVPWPKIYRNENPMKRRRATEKCIIASRGPFSSVTATSWSTLNFASASCVAAIPREYTGWPATNLNNLIEQQNCLFQQHISVR